jgi:ABC-type dipeptide/oligopeptide/nickel transport system permease component
MAGPVATASQIAQIRTDLGLTQPIPVQYVRYVARLPHGDLGTSWYTSNPVTTDLVQRAPATLELITLALLGIICLGLIIAAGILAVGPRDVVGRLITAYDFVAE